MRKYIVTMLNAKEEKEVHTVLAHTILGALKEAHRIYGSVDIVDVFDMAH